MVEVMDKKLAKQIRIRVEPHLLETLKTKAQGCGMSLSSYTNVVLNSLLKDQVVSFEEKINKYEKKEVKSRPYFTKSEIELLRQYAELNDWSLAKEIRYRIVSTLAKKPKLSKEELRAVYSVRSSVGMLGANINSLIRNNLIIPDSGADSMCKELLELIAEIISKIDYLEKCSHTHFKL